MSRWATLDTVPDFNITQEKIVKLISELRTWEPGEACRTLAELAEMFELDFFVVDRVATSEGHHLLAGGVPDGGMHSDPNATTIDLDPEEVHGALEKPDPNPDWENSDEDTGVWRKKPTGEWERVAKSRRSDAPED